MSSLGGLQARDRGSLGWGEESSAKGAPGQGDRRSASEEEVDREARATANLVNLGGHTLRMLVPALLVLLFCFRGSAGTARRERMNMGWVWGDCLRAAPSLGRRELGAGTPGS